MQQPQYSYPHIDSMTPARSPLVVSTSMCSPTREADDFAVKTEPRAVLLPVFADLIRASHLANSIDVSRQQLPSIKNSLRFILDSASVDSIQAPLDSPSAAHTDDEESSSPASPTSPTLSARASGKQRPANRTCKFDGCSQYVVDHGLCVRHGGGKRCTMEGCTSRAKHYGRCWRHGGSMECKVGGCVNRAKSRGYCWSHGGGTKCKSDDCDKIAISNGLCWAHGGGKRCASTGCMKQAYERTDNLCNSHFRQTKKLRATAAH